MRPGPICAAVMVWALLWDVMPSLAGEGSMHTLSGKALIAPHPALPDAVVATTPPVVDFIIFPDLSDGGPGTLWSSWGDGCIASNGRYYTSIGNHMDAVARGETGQAMAPGDSRMYEYDPAGRSLTLRFSVRGIQPDPAVAGGKIHARIDQGRDGWLYTATYWGKIPTDGDWQAGFKGSMLLRHDPRTGRTEDLGVILPKQGIPTSLTDGQRMLFHGYAARSGDLFVYDLVGRKLMFRGGGDIQDGSRNIILDLDGNPYFSTTDGKLAKLDLATRQIRADGPTLPRPPSAAGTKKGRLRASTRASKSGIVYVITDAGVMFAFDTKQNAIRDLGPCVDSQYTAVMVLSPDEKYVYYAPGAHGSGARIGTPVVQYDISAGRHKVLAFLNPVLRKEHGYNIGGTYNLKVSGDGSTLFITFNGARLTAGARREETFGLPCITVVHVPAEDR